MSKKIAVLLLLLALCGCAKKPSEPPQAVDVQDVVVDMNTRQQTLLQAFPVDDMEGLLPPGDLVAFDQETSVDDNGSFKIHAPGQQTLSVPLYEVPMDTVDAGLVAPGQPVMLQAQIMTKSGFQGQVFLELSGSYGNRPFAAQGIASGVGDTKGQWVTVESPFYPKKDQPLPGRFRIAVTASGPGDVWVDDIRLVSTPPAKGELSKPESVR